jgi:hypothetical protein
VEVVRYILVAGLAGAVAGLVAVAAILCLDVGSLGTLVAGSDDGWIAGALLSLGFMTTFGSAAIGAAVMAIGGQRR